MRMRAIHRPGMAAVSPGVGSRSFFLGGSSLGDVAAVPAERYVLSSFGPCWCMTGRWPPHPQAIWRWWTNTTQRMTGIGRRCQLDAQVGCSTYVLFRSRIKNRGLKIAGKPNAILPRTYMFAEPATSSGNIALHCVPPSIYNMMVFVFLSLILLIPRQRPPHSCLGAKSWQGWCSTSSPGDGIPIALQ